MSATFADVRIGRVAAGGAVGSTAMALAIAAAATALPIVAHGLGQAAGLTFCVVLACLVANFAAAAAPATLVCAFLFQNFVVALISPTLASPADFNAVRGYNSLLTAGIWLVLAVSYWTRPAVAAPGTRRLMLASSAVLATICLYFAAGAMANPTNALIYLRNFALPLLAFQIGLVAASRSAGDLSATLKPLGWVALAYGYTELFARTSLYELVGVETYLGFGMRQQIESGVWLRELQETGRVIRGLEDTLRVDLLNTPLFADLGIQLHRLLGPNLHSVSFAYGLSAFALLFLARGQWLFPVAVVPLLVVIGSKGALVSILLPAAALLALRIVRPRVVLALLLGALAVYIAGAIVLGLQYGDYHVMGLIGGLNGFLRNPLGHGLGSGGNLSIDMSRIDWSRSQALGQTDLAVESAVGVLLFQLGFAGLLVCAVPIAIALRCWRLAVVARRPVLAAVAVGLLTLTANGLLQEEAMFAPLALGIIMLLAGLASGERSASGREPQPPEATKPRPDRLPASPRRADAAADPDLVAVGRMAPFGGRRL